MDTKDITKGSFYGYIKNQRKAFALEVSKYSVEHNLKLRTESDSLLIAYDQMRDRIKELDYVLEKIYKELPKIHNQVIKDLMKDRNGSRP